MKYINIELRITELCLLKSVRDPQTGSGYENFPFEFDETHRFT